MRKWMGVAMLLHQMASLLHAGQVPHMLRMGPATSSTRKGGGGNKRHWLVRRGVVV